MTEREWMDHRLNRMTDRVYEYRRTRLDQLKEELKRLEKLRVEAIDIDSRIEWKKKEIAEEDAREVKTPPLPDYVAIG